MESPDPIDTLIKPPKFVPGMEKPAVNHILSDRRKWEDVAKNLERAVTLVCETAIPRRR